MTDKIIEDLRAENEKLRAEMERLQAEKEVLAGQMRSPYLTRPEAASYLRIPVNTLDRWLAMGRLPRHRAFGRVFLRRDQVEGIVKVDGDP